MERNQQRSCPLLKHPLKIALLGYGKMGHIVEQIATDRGHEIVAKINSQSNEIENLLSPADVCIDFTRPDKALSNLKKAASLGLNIVMGTTGWQDQLDEAKKIVSEANIGFLYSPNFSIGVALFYRLISQATTLIGKFEDYDVSGSEIHHRKKADSPSGTALLLSDAILDAHPLKSKTIFNSPSSPSSIEELHFTCLRTGSVPGTHTISFDSEEDTITLTHTARGRQGFAKGAITAAEWLVGKKGFFCLDDMLKDHF